MDSSCWNCGEDEQLEVVVVNKQEGLREYTLCALCARMLQELNWTWIVA